MYLITEVVHRTHCVSLHDVSSHTLQRGDAEMENRMNRLMRACCDLGDRNPIVSVHDQGAGGNGNVLKEIVEPAGAEYDIRKVRFIES
jgi:phosphoribosylformylglycinamidine synthase